MRKRYQTLVDLDATAEDRAASADRGLRWLVEQGVVRPETVAREAFRRCGEHPPGERWHTAVAPSDGEPGDGVTVVAVGCVFDGGPLREPEQAWCPHCAGRLHLLPTEGRAGPGGRQPWDRVKDAIDTWVDTGRAVLACGHCGRDGDLTAWTWEGNYFAFAHLGFEFWDWPELRDSFVEEFARVLDGHRLTVVRGSV
ncbi:hypothetical protein [Streptomyces fragilis]|uniref:Uncharacterized protein n=1 Tax=Streptomyces fragilis TaxID=67301 RepID=A0ABV2YB72_9ACTN|nr:hypothetical protein [Streptomyces fragilis]